MHDVNLLRSDWVSCPTFLRSMWARSEWGRVSMLWLIFSTRLAYLLRLKTANTAFVVPSFNFHVWWYSPTVAMSLLCTPLFVNLHQHAWLLGHGVRILSGEVVAGQRCRCWGEGVPRLIIEGRRSWGVVTCSVCRRRWWGWSCDYQPTPWSSGLCTCQVEIAVTCTYKLL